MFQLHNELYLQEISYRLGLFHLFLHLRSSRVGESSDQEPVDIHVVLQDQLLDPLDQYRGLAGSCRSGDQNVFVPGRNGFFLGAGPSHA